MSFESKVKTIVEEIVNDLMIRNYKNLELNGRIGKLDVEGLEDIREFYGGNLPNPMSGSFEKISTHEMSKNNFIASFLWHSDTKSCLSLHFNGKSFESGDVMLSISFICKTSIRLATCPPNYFLENAQVYEDMPTLLKCFVNDGERILFEFREWEPEKYKETCYQERDSDLESFRDRFIYKQETVEEKVKEILLNSYWLKAGISEDKRVTTSVIKENLLDRFMGGDLEEFEPDIEDKVWEVIFHYIYKFNLEGCEQEDQQFIKDRVVFVNKEELFNREVSEAIKHFLWYGVESSEEIKNALRIDDWFTCVIIGEGKKFDEYSYALNYYEDHAEHIDGMVLRIKEGLGGNFEQDILPKLKNIMQFDMVRNDKYYSGWVK